MTRVTEEYIRTRVRGEGNSRVDKTMTRVRV